MDAHRFDRLTKRLLTGTDRRAAIRLAGAGALASVLPAVGLASAAAEIGADACVPNGNRCGKNGQPKCANCCSRNTERQKITRQRRCTCRADFRKCRRPDQCCSGICEAGCGCPPSEVTASAADKRCLPGLFGGPGESGPIGPVGP